MAARDLFHTAVKVALQKESWIITDDPLKVEVGGAKFEIDLGAERLLAAEREGVKIMKPSSNESSCRYQLNGIKLIGFFMTL